MARKQTYRVKLSQSERDHLKNLVSSGESKARKLTQARILLKADEGWTDDQIAEALDVGRATVGRIRTLYATEGLLRRLDGISRRDQEHPRPRRHRGEPPEGQARWTLRLLAERFVTLEQVEVESVSHETVRQTLKKTNLSLGRTSNG